jgi:hypothetical protein
MNDPKPISESVLLRTLTKKSVLWFGKHCGLKVQQVIDIRCQTYLRWIYYNFIGITFTEDILEDLTITENRRIPKPGIAPEKHVEVMEENRKSLYYQTKGHMDKIVKIRSKCKLIKTYRSVDFKRSQLQAINLNRY